MATPKKGSRLGSGPAHQELLLAQQAGDLFRHGRITTTHAKARMLRPYAEKLITKGKQGDLAARRVAQSKLRDRDVVAYLFEDVAPRFADRPGGYTRIMKLGPRAGDNAPMAIIELVEQATERGETVIEDAKAGRSRGLFGRGRRRAAAAVEAAGEAVADVVENVSESAAETIEDAAETVADAVDDSDAVASADSSSSDADSSDADSSDADASGADKA